MAEQFWRIGRIAGFGLGLLLLIGLLVVLQNGGKRTAVAAGRIAEPVLNGRPLRISRPVTETVTSLYLPSVVRSDSQPTSTPTAMSLPPRQWDPRLDQRGAELRPAVVSPGQGYWRLVKAVWFDEQESGGLHHILVDVLDAGGARKVGVPVRVYWAAGETILTTQAKPGEAYAADFGMFDIAPSYGALPNDGSPADEVWGMGLGSIEQPKFTIHTSYGLTWQWTIAGGTTDTPTPTATPTPSPSATPTDSATATPSPTASATWTPTPTPTATAASAPTLDWDPRLTQRGASLQAAPVAPGQGYWKLTRARWFDEQESGNRQHILVDALDAGGQRVVGLPVRVYWAGGEATITTEAKPGEEYAANYPLAFPAPFYNAAPNDGSPADAVLGMGLGSLANSTGFIRASYGLTWRWTIASAATETPTATPTPTPTPSPTITATPAPTPTPTTADYLFNQAQLIACEANAGITYVQGMLRLGGQPASGYRVAFSYAADGPVVAETLSGPHSGYAGWNPGYYSHILQVGGPRAGDWWFWIRDDAGQRISVLGAVHTDGTAGSGQCQQAVIDFDGN